MKMTPLRPNYLPYKIHHQRLEDLQDPRHQIHQFHLHIPLHRHQMLQMAEILILERHLREQYLHTHQHHLQVF